MEREGTVNEEARLLTLSRMNIIRRFDRNTPICVVLECAEAVGITCHSSSLNEYSYRSKVMQRVESRTLEINDPPSGEDLQHLACFVNCQEQSWPVTRLLEAFYFLLPFTQETDDILPLLPADFTAGRQTASSPCSVDSCVLYRICWRHGINVDHETTLEQMADIVRLLQLPRSSLFQLILRNLETRSYLGRNQGGSSSDDYIRGPDSTTTRVINLLTVMCEEIPEVEERPNIVDLSYGRMENLYSSLTNLIEVQRLINPETQEGAVALAAILYQIDISTARDKIDEYHLLSLVGRDRYEPIDRKFREQYEKNPLLFDLRRSFNPLFPQVYYGRDVLYDMAVAEGFHDRELAESSPYDLMCLAWLTETFYSGIVPEVTAIETPVGLESLDTLEPGSILSYGERRSEMKPITLQELTQLFTINQCFVNPFESSSLFPPRAISKLKLLCGHQPDGEESINDQKRRLLSVIDAVELFVSSTDGRLRAFSQAYQRSDSVKKGEIEAALTALLCLAMYMRGWMGDCTAYPITLAPVNPEDLERVNVNSSAGIIAFEEACRVLGNDMGEMVQNLPLLNYIDGQFVASTTREYGFTIRDRINIVKGGESTRNMNSCIRLSSNWFAASAHRYMTLIGLSSPFPVTQLRHIS